MDFHVVLPSTASPSIYSDNKTSNFKVQLAQRLDLRGDWQVALMEIHYPNTIDHVTKGMNWIYFRSPKIEMDYTVKTGNFTSASELLNAVRIGFKEYLAEWPATSVIAEQVNRLTIGKTGDGHFYFTGLSLDFTFEFSPTLALQLGFASAGPHPAHVNMSGSRPIDLSLGVPSQMYIYMNIIQDQIVGHTRTPLLRTIPVDISAKYGTVTVYKCDQPLYFDLCTRSFDTIEVNIRTGVGDFMPFDHGALTLLCHFKRRSA